MFVSYKYKVISVENKANLSNSNGYVYSFVITDTDFVETGYSNFLNVMTDIVSFYKKKNYTLSQISKNVILWLRSNNPYLNISNNFYTALKDLEYEEFQIVSEIIPYMNKLLIFS